MSTDGRSTTSDPGDSGEIPVDPSSAGCSDEPPGAGLLHRITHKRQTANFANSDIPLKQDQQNRLEAQNATVMYLQQSPLERVLHKLGRQNRSFIAPFYGNMIWLKDKQEQRYPDPPSVEYAGD